MSPSRSSLWTKTVAVGVIVVASVVGNVSLSASEALPQAAPTSSAHPSVGVAGIASTTSAIESPQAVTASASSMLAAEAMSGFSYSKFDARVMGAERAALPSLASDVPDAVASSEFGHVVPAIYAWDPDVRFVFYRHVSKWR